MNSLKSLKMKKVEGFFTNKKDIKKARVSLEQKTESDFREFARSKQKIREIAHKKQLD